MSDVLRFAILVNDTVDNIILLKEENKESYQEQINGILFELQEDSIVDIGWTIQNGTFHPPTTE